MFFLRLLQILFLPGLSPQAEAPAPAVPQSRDLASTFRSSGRVVDAVSGQPLGRASVSISVSATPDAPASLDSSRVELTDPEGRFVFAGVAPGKYSLSAHRRGYFPQMYQQHESFTTAIFVGPGLESENLGFVLRRSASISGRGSDDR